MKSSSGQRRPPPKIRLPLWGVVLLTLVLGIFLVISGIWLFRTVREVAASWQTDSPRFVDSEENTGDSGMSGLDEPLVSASTPVAGNDTALSPEALQPWSGYDRVTILFLGIDLRCDEEGPTHTDSMMVITIDPVGMSAAALSLPRDLWVEIPGYGVNRINQAYFMGEAYDYPGGGAALAMETVEATLGVPVDYYAAINFQAFIDFVDLTDGITVNVEEPIEDPTYPDNCYGYDPFFIGPGEHDLDGAQALKYARTRATAGGDVDRAGRQQEVVLAVRDKVLQLNMIPRLLVQAPQLWQSFRQNVKTNLKLDEALQLALLAQDIPRDSIRMEVIDYDYVYNETTPDGQQVLVPNRESIRALRDQLFSPAAIPTPVIENLPQMMREEAARVVVNNGTSVFGLASETQDYLRGYGIQVVEVGNADSSTYPSTQILDFGTHPNTTRYIAELMGVPPLNISYSSKTAEDYDVLVIIGNDWSVPTPTPP
jgi:LCP family protein required for cell wall assembly